MLSKCAASATLAGALMFSSSAIADTALELATATDHAGYATTSLNLSAIHEHLHHAVNCLVGSGRKEFDSGVENPCAKMGRGAIVDVTDPTLKAKLEDIVAEAQSGISSNDEATARGIAVKVYSTLRTTK
jgi:hypothetical protein